MPGAGRLGDKAQIQSDAHGCPGCPHPGVGPAIVGSTNVNINSRPALRVDDMGIHAVCCGPNTWQAQKGSSTVFINGKAAFRKDDMSKHCGGSGKLIEGSDNVLIGDAAGGGSGSGGGGGNAQSSSGGSGGASGQGQAQQSPASQPAQSQQQQQQQQTQPKKAPAQWSIELADGTAVRGVTAKFEGSPGPKDVSGSRGNVPGLNEGEEYSLTPTGTVKVQGKIEDGDGKPVAKAKVHIERSWGPAVDVETDGSGKFEAEGFVNDEPFEVSVVEAPAKLSGKFEDEDGKPVAGVKARIVAEGGRTVEVTSGSDGKWEADGIFAGEDHHLELVSTSEKATGKFVDDDGKPKAGVRARVVGDAGTVVEVFSAGDGTWSAEGFLPGEHYHVEVEPQDPDKKGK
jgi:uncharacterized Zn-binding protein involved in type VI secretion